ncbi:hypothetical protein ACJJTC_014376 [Scirpophaga incertulas]
MFLIKVLKKYRKIILIVFLIVFSCIIITLTDFLPDFYFIHWNDLENLSCHHTDAEDVLPSAEDMEFPSTIFFHETSCKGGLDSRQACAVESAARAHPYWDINVLFTAPATEKSLKKSTYLLKELNNIRFYRINVIQYSKGTPLEAFVARGALNRTKWRISHASDVLRYLTLFKWGGVYLDLDVVVARPLYSLSRNWAARENEYSVAAGAMAFSKDNVGRYIAEAAIRDIKRNYRGDVWGHNGPGVITRVLKKICSSGDVSKMSAVTCKGFEVYGPEYFYPVEWQRALVYFEPGELSNTGSYGYHVWNHFTQHFRVVNGSPFDSLARKYCPIVYKVYSKDFV